MKSPAHGADTADRGQDGDKIPHLTLHSCSFPSSFGLLTPSRARSISSKGGKAILVRWGCYNKLPETRGLIHNRNLFLSVLEGEKSKIKGLEDVKSREGLLPSLQMAVFSLSPYMA